MSFYRMYKQQKSRATFAHKQVVDETINPRLRMLLENKEVPENTVAFLQSLLGANEKYNGLTERQYEAMQKVEHRFTAENIAKRNSWASEYDDKKRKIAKVCAQYYLENPPYYRDLAIRIVGEEDFVPTERQYRALCENKYTTKVLAATYDEPLFPVGAMVQGRACAARQLQNRLMVIIETNAAPVTIAARGSKVYRVLPVGSAETLFVLERDLKKSKKTKKTA